MSIVPKGRWAFEYLFQTLRVCGRIDIRPYAELISYYRAGGDLAVGACALRVRISIRQKGLLAFEIDPKRCAFAG